MAGMATEKRLMPGVIGESILNQAGRHAPPTAEADEIQDEAMAKLDGG